MTLPGFFFAAQHCMIIILDIDRKFIADCGSDNTYQLYTNNVSCCATFPRFDAYAAQFILWQSSSICGLSLEEILRAACLAQQSSASLSLCCLSYRPEYYSRNACGDVFLIVDIAPPNQVYI